MACWILSGPLVKLSPPLPLTVVAQAFSAAGNLTVATPSDIIRISATGTAAYTITAPANATVGALNFNNSRATVSFV